MSKSLKTYLKFNFVIDNKQQIFKIIFTVILLMFAFWFFKQERSEFANIKVTLGQAQIHWILIGLLVTVLYIVLQGYMYVHAFASVNCKYPLKYAIILFLKRNFVSVFLPAGGISSLAFFSNDRNLKNINRSEVYFASAIYAYIGIVSVVLVTVPFLLVMLITKSDTHSIIPALVGVVVLVFGLFVSYYSVKNKGYIFKTIERLMPKVAVFLEDMVAQDTNKRHLIITLIFSLLIEVTGVLHVYIAMLALGLIPSLYTAVLAYLVSVLFLIVSPFLRGLGAIEISISYILIRSGLPDALAISVTLLYRFFEFWLPFFAGVLSFIYKVNKILMRILPPFGAFVVGVINIVSAVTPPIKVRFRLLHQLIPLDVINASNTFVLILGIFLIALSAFLYRGLKSAWWMALILMGASLVGHLTKGFDFEEATIAFIAGIVLLLSRKEYNVHTDPRLRTKGIQTAIIAIISVFIYGIVGFYFLNKRNFHIDFSLSQSVIYTFENFFLFRSDELIPKSRLAHTFIYTIQASGLLTLGFLFYMFLRSLLIKNKPTDEELQRANALLKAYGSSTLDYFKTYTDKSLFVSQNIEAFLAFRISGSFAVVLENPVAASNQDFKACVTAFERYCKDNGLKDIYYRVPKPDLNSYTDLNKKVMRIGEEAVVDAFAFSLQGAAMKSIRNANNKIRDKGFVCKVYNPPLKDGFIQKLKAVSDAWLRDLEREEMVFSQGMFNEAELKNQAVLAVENEEEKVVAFVNIIPDYKNEEGTYDLIRKTENAPNGMMDFLMTELFQYFKTNGIQFVNIGFVPISGDNESKKIIKKTLNFAYKNIASFSHYKGQREFKDKFKPQWEQRYLIYTNDFDLINIPAALKKVIKPV